MAKRIGKGLTELLANIEDARVQEPLADVVDGENVYQLELSKIRPNKNQPRKHFDEAAQHELEDSIRTHGIIQPLILVKAGDGYQIVAGERRYRAAQAVGLRTVPALVKVLSEQNIKEISLIENLQREDLNAIEEAEALNELASAYGLTQMELSKRIGKSRSNIANTMRLVGLEREVKDLVRSERLSAGHARCLVPVANKEDQIALAYRACDNQMSVRELEQRVKYYLNPELAPKVPIPPVKTKLTPELKHFSDDLKRIFATKVKIVGTPDKGRIFIDYGTQDDLARIFALMEKLR